MNNWLNERSKLYAKYAEKMPKSTNYVQVSFDPPQYGWICMHISVNYNEKACITLSADTDNPFEKIIRWLESIVTSDYGVSLTMMDCDPNLVTMYFDPILYWDGYRGHAFRDGYCGLFYVYDTDGHKIIVDTLCTSKDLVKAIYTSIISYAKEMQQNDNFVEEWTWHLYNHELDGYDEDSPELKEYFLKKVRSEILENYLGLNSNYFK